jgi:chlorite dismutase
MITIGMNYKVIEGKQEAFTKMFDHVLDVMKDMPGHRESHLYVDTKDNCSFLIVSEWRQKKAFDEFVASPTFAKVVTWGKEQILADRPRHNVYGEDEPS